MAKKRINTDEVASRFISGIPNDEEKNDEEKNMEVKINEKRNNKTEKTERTRPYIQSSGYQQRAYYISDEQYKELKLLAIEHDTDTSSLVREALDQFLNRK